jgi:hypothetical protein
MFSTRFSAIIDSAGGMLSYFMDMTDSATSSTEATASLEAPALVSLGLCNVSAAHGR